MPTRSARGCSSGSGRSRVVDTPISEEGFAGIGIGAAMTGLRPIIEFMTFSFSLVAIDQIVNNAANMRYMSGGQFAVPIVFRGSSGMAGCLGATHSHRLEAWYAQVPGLTVILPATPADAKGLLKSAIRSDDPVVFIEHEVLYHDKGEVPDGEHLVPIGKAEVKRPRLRRHAHHLFAFLEGDARRRREAGRRGDQGRGDRPPHRQARSISIRSSNPSRRHTAPSSSRKTGPIADWAPASRTGSAGASSTSSTRRSRASPPRTRRYPTTKRSSSRCSRRSTGSSRRSTMFYMFECIVSRCARPANRETSRAD